MTLEQELGALLTTLGLRSRQRGAVARRLGWDGGPPATLSDAGRLNDYTRERVRQLEERVVDGVMRSRPQLPVTAAAVAVLGDAVPTARREAASLLAERGLSDEPFDPAGVLRAARLAGLPVEVVAHRRALLRSEDVTLTPVVATIAQKLARRHGAASPAAVAELAGLRMRRVRRLLELGDAVSWLGETGWFTLLPFSGEFASMMFKLLAAAPDAPPGDVRSALASDLPLDVVGALLPHARGGRGLSTTERAIVDALRRD